MSWQDRVNAQVRATRGRQRVSRTTPFGAALKPLQFSATLKFMAYVHAAAEKMDANRSTYIRRALAVHAANVLGVSVLDVLYESPVNRVAHELHNPGIQQQGLRDLGEGIEAWCPHPGCDGSHLSVPNSGQPLP